MLMSKDTRRCTYIQTYDMEHKKNSVLNELHKHRLNITFDD